MRDDLPTGTVTFLFTDVEGSTRLLEEIGDEAYEEALSVHRRIVRAACQAHDGVEVDTQGDAFFFAFPEPSGALAAAQQMTEGLAAGPIQVRIGLHTGTPRLGEEGYVGSDVHFGARVAASAHGGQAVLSQATRDLVEGYVLTDLGEHRLKDIEHAVAIFQLSDESFPPLKTISNTNLPRPASSFVGREQELKAVLALFEEGARLVTLTGPGGSGKTRLALEAASTLVPEYKAGVFWVGLAALRDPALVTETIAQTLGAKDGLAEHIGEREMLLLLDNLEQVIAAAPELSALAASCPNLTLVCTSRELLRVQGEVEYEVPPLASPEAVSLFCERSRLERSDEIAELCARLDDLPLAVELAAARTKALSPAQILERLSQRFDLLKGGRDADARQQTLRATIEWSYELLSVEERELFARLSVFAGGCTLEAAEEVSDADLDTLQSLVEKSLLRFTNERYWMLETIREYAGDRLKGSGDDQTWRRHAQHFIALAEEAQPHIERAPNVWLPRLRAEHDNFRAALDRQESTSEPGLALRLAGALVSYWEAGHVAEGRQRLESALSRDSSRSADRAKALAGAALLAHHSADAPTVRLRAGQALSLYRELGDASGMANATMFLGAGVAGEGDFAHARELFEDAAELFREAGHADKALFATRMHGWMHEELGDLERARAVHEENLGRARALANRQVEAQTLSALANLAILHGQPRDAVSMMKDVLRIDHDDGADLQIAFDLSRFARALAFAGGADAEATRLISCAEALREQIGAGAPPWLVRATEEALAIVRRNLDLYAFATAWEEGVALAVDDAVALALASLDSSPPATPPSRPSPP